jgi:hypothetical protein
MLRVEPSSKSSQPSSSLQSKPKRVALDVEEEQVIGGDVTDGTKTLHDPTSPDMSTFARHNTTHVPYASWCEHCTEGRAVSTKRERRDVQLRVVVGKRRAVSIDYCFLRVNDSRPQVTVLRAADSHTGYSNALVVDAKGVNKDAISWLRRFVQELGSPTVNLHSDDESSAKALTRALAQEAVKEIGGGMTCTTTCAPTGSHESNGKCERWIRTVEGLIRTYVSAAVNNGIEVQAKHSFYAGSVRHAAFVYNSCHGREDGGGRIPYYAIYGRAFGSPMLELGECVFGYIPTALQLPKSAPRWTKGFLMGRRSSADGHLVRTPAGGIKLFRSIRRAGLAERWGPPSLLTMVATPTTNK